MRSLKNIAILLRLVRTMREQGNWCGETHLQKAVYFFQNLAAGSTNFDFVLYRHGPFSFQLRDELTTLRADDLLELNIQPQPYGPKLIPTKHAADIEAKFPKTLSSAAERINFIAHIVGDKGVGELERISTALFVSQEATLHRSSVRARAERLHELKPHISLDAASTAVKSIDNLIKEANKKKFAPQR